MADGTTLCVMTHIKIILSDQWLYLYTEINELISACTTNIVPIFFPPNSTCDEVNVVGLSFRIHNE